jgi:hypothetical protein
MSVIKILSGLEGIDAKGLDADVAARIGFLEWAFALPGAATPEAARAALNVAPALVESAAAQTFVSYLHQASRHMMPPVRRSRAARIN